MWGGLGSKRTMIDRDAILWVCERECEQVNMNKSFLEYFTNIDKIFGKYYLRHGIEYLVTWRKILSCVHRWKIFKDENLDDKWKWMNFLMYVDNWTKNWIKEKRCQKYMLVYFEKFETWNAQVIVKIILHIYLIWSILSFKAFKPYKMLN
jgi:hypothetical protein